MTKLTKQQVVVLHEYRDKWLAMSKRTCHDVDRHELQDAIVRFDEDGQTCVRVLMSILPMTVIFVVVAPTLVI